MPEASIILIYFKTIICESLHSKDYFENESSKNTTKNKNFFFEKNYIKFVFHIKVSNLKAYHCKV